MYFFENKRIHIAGLLLVFLENHKNVHKHKKQERTCSDCHNFSKNSPQQGKILPSVPLVTENCQIRLAQVRLVNTLNIKFLKAFISGSARLFLFGYSNICFILYLIYSIYSNNSSYSNFLIILLSTLRLSNYSNLLIKMTSLIEINSLKCMRNCK